VALKQLGLGPSLSIKRTRKDEFVDEIERAVP
jgi:hypothetical protein